MKGFGKLPKHNSSLRQEHIKIFRVTTIAQRKYNASPIKENQEIASRNFDSQEGAKGFISGNVESTSRAEDCFEKPGSVDEGHWDEWVLGSCIDSEIAALNLRSLCGDEPYRYLIPDPGKVSGRVQGDAQWRYLRGKYGHVEAGGWWCCGVDILTGHMSEWGCFKPNTPRVDSDGKVIKYEHPPKTQLEAFFLRVSVRVFELISRRYDVPVPSDYADVLSEPMIFWQWVIDNNIPIIITEGCKKAAAILSCGYVALALPGIRSGYRVQRDEYGEAIGQPTLIPQLAPFATLGRRIYFAFDQDSKRSTRRDVNSAIRL